MNTAEEYVARLCNKTFLSLWTYPTPLGPSGKELCDLLVACGPDVLIFSVKEIEFKNTGRYGIDSGRWERKAVDASIRQLFGAERALERMTAVATTAGDAAPEIPGGHSRRVHRIAIAIGGSDHVGISSGDHTGRFVHVFDAQAFSIIVQELDTITDFVEYIRAKEALQAGVLMEGGEEDLLAVYLTNDCAFPAGHDMFLCGEDIWATFSGSEDYKAWHRKNRESYLWDRIIETVAGDMRSGKLMGNADFDTVERALRVMAREDRRDRGVLARAFLDFRHECGLGKTAARIALAPRGITYVFLARPPATRRADRSTELLSRCLVARQLHPENVTVVGIATETPNDAHGFSIDLVHMHLPKLTDEQVELATKIRDELGYFRQQVPVDPPENGA